MHVFYMLRQPTSDSHFMMVFIITRTDVSLAPHSFKGAHKMKRDSISFSTLDDGRGLITWPLSREAGIILHTVLTENLRRKDIPWDEVGTNIYQSGIRPAMFSDGFYIEPGYTAVLKSKGVDLEKVVQEATNVWERHGYLPRTWKATHARRFYAAWRRAELATNRAPENVSAAVVPKPRTRKQAAELSKR